MHGEQERAFVEYVSARRTAWHREAYLLCGDGHLADDIVQSAATVLYRHWRRARAADNLDAYVRRILVHKYLDEVRRSRLRTWLTPAPPERPAPPSGDVEERDSLRAALARLPRSQRTVLVLRFFCDLSVAETAATLRCSDSNIKNHTSRGLAALRRVLDVDHTAR
ncbi:SigE family RNA polymerase sigma factor [Virgisporangium ochraceum]|uniref:RNA polymerase sigma24 factor n=1 Tax=Virgisporangium ochraceum TaxID=65505 RepID=A0A8J4EGN4_9ACTN|nr:SigE family RNA polymerase sigma factor [Virgisporangium ochraceum]GIJ71322.1 RNA polymerase sigma24 factor [Virgisporangium ochraceum]